MKPWILQRNRVKKSKRKNSPASLTLCEDDIQKAIFEWSSSHPILKIYMYHVPNGGYYLSAAARQRLLNLGLKPGVSDIFIDYPVYPYHGFYLELKTLKGIATPEQKYFLETRRSVGYKTDIARSFEEAKTKIEDYLRGN